MQTENTEIMSVEEQEAFDADMAKMWWGWNYTGYPILRFKDWKMVLKLGDAEKEYTELEWCRLVFYSQKYDLILENAKWPWTSVWYSSEFYNWQVDPGHLYLASWEKYNRHEVANLKEAREMLDSIAKEDKTLSKVFFDVLYIDTPDWIMKMYLKYTQSAWVEIIKNKWEVVVNARFWNPIENSFRAIKKLHPWDLHKYTYTISVDSYTPGKWLSDVTMPLFTNELECNDATLPGKIMEITKKIKEGELQKISRSVDSEAPEEEDVNPKITEGAKKLKDKNLDDDDLPF